MINKVDFSAKSLMQMRNRDVSEQEVSAFASILQQANNSDKSAKQFLSGLSQQDLSLVQKVNALAEKINVNALSAEGAQNLLTEPGAKDKVDLNNDGIVEVGIARNIFFPPVNAPQHIKDAWEKASEGLSFSEKGMIEFTMHSVVYGVPIDGLPKKQALHPSQQWSGQGLNDFFNTMYSNLEFRVGLEGMTDYNRMLERVYGSFEQEIAKFDSNYKVEDRQAHGKSSSPSDMPKDAQSRLAVINQLILDGRLGVDREKLKEIDAKMEEIANDPNLTNEQKQEMLMALQEQKEKIIQQAQQPEQEEKKRREALTPTERIGEDIQILQLKNQVQRAWQLQ